MFSTTASTTATTNDKFALSNSVGHTTAAESYDATTTTAYVFSLLFYIFVCFSAPNKSAATMRPQINQQQVRTPTIIHPTPPQVRAQLPMKVRSFCVSIFQKYCRVTLRHHLGRHRAIYRLHYQHLLVHCHRCVCFAFSYL
jgi:hypothetical protein